MLDTTQEMLEREPFQKFRINSTGGDRYEVDNPHLPAIMQWQFFHGCPKSNRFAFIRFNQIVSVPTLDQAA